MATTNLAIAQNMQAHGPHTFNALQHLVKAMAKVAKQQGKKSIPDVSKSHFKTSWADQAKGQCRPRSATTVHPATPLRTVRLVPRIRLSVAGCF